MIPKRLQQQMLRCPDPLGEIVKEGERIALDRARASDDGKPYYRCKHNLRCRKCNGYWPDKCRCVIPPQTEGSGS